MKTDIWRISPWDVGRYFSEESCSRLSSEVLINHVNKEKETFWSCLSKWSLHRKNTNSDLCGYEWQEMLLSESRQGSFHLSTAIRHCRDFSMLHCVHILLLSLPIPLPPSPGKTSNFSLIHRDEHNNSFMLARSCSYIQGSDTSKDLVQMCINTRTI